MNQPSVTQQAIKTWKLAHRLVLDLYQISSHLPQDERDGLTRTIRRSGVTVASNIVAGHAERNEPEFAQRITAAAAALEETKYALLVARDLGYLAEVTYDRLMRDAEHVSEELEAMRGQFDLGSAETPAALPERSDDPDPAGGNIPFMPSERTFAKTKSMGDTAKDLWNWLKGTPGRVSSQDDLEERIWTEDSGRPGYLEDPDKEKV